MNSFALSFDRVGKHHRVRRVKRNSPPWSCAGNGYPLYRSYVPVCLIPMIDSKTRGAAMEAGHGVRKIFRFIVFFISNIPTFVFFDLFLGYTEGSAGGMFGLTDKLVAFFENILGGAGLLPDAQHTLALAIIGAWFFAGFISTFYRAIVR